MTISTRIIRRSVLVAALVLGTAALFAPVASAGLVRPDGPDGRVDQQTLQTVNSALVRPDGPDGRVERQPLQTVNGGLVSKSLIEAHYAHEARDASRAGFSQPTALGADGTNSFAWNDALVGWGFGFGMALMVVAAAALLRRNRARLAGF